ncbi:Gibberellin 20-oxidase-like protein [Vitis vinifera]|uniref:Gibberellin 20-oxidase-like protein n=1 Tax=Vitis vinifera TaxID=29760 RepID=A0A438JJV5_VITVI|nr:Gibberellin 20-oxidase-like protein [Vitis vinifera]
MGLLPCNESWYPQDLFSKTSWPLLRVLLLNSLTNKISEFSETLQEYGSKMVELSKRIVEAVLMSLGDGYERKFNESEFNNCQGYLRLVNYSPPECVEDEEVEGLGMHTDMSCITIVYQDEIGGLQMRSKGGEWIDITPCEGTLVVNIGDLMQGWSNGRLRSSEHRVVLKRFVNRLSLAFFGALRMRRWCWHQMKSWEKETRGFTSHFVCLEYLKFRESNEEGKYEKVGYTVKDFAALKLEMK